MPLLTVIGVFLVVAVLLGLVNWLAHKFPVFINATVIQILNAVVIVALVLWVLALFLPIGNLSTIRVGH
jgi:flagellar biosynthesis protein FliR